MVLVFALATAGVVHVQWLRSPWSRPFAIPIDGGLYLNGQRLFGDNKMLRGLMVMPPASALSFGLLGAGRDHLPAWMAEGLWNISSGQLAWVGFCCGLAFMLAELPNSFLKRQLGVQPGDAAEQPTLRLLCMVLDRVDSTLGVLLTLSLLLPVHPLTWFWALLLGAGIHWLFSAWLYLLAVKKRVS
jgi:CDP-2,3-bis-(O-geranylgeranyl)-sn-glycerol synthase